MERIHQAPRIWSNNELAHFSSLFNGDVVNVSAWRDEDKQGKRYKDYFSNATSYTITNFDADKRGLQGIDGELFLDLEKEMPHELIEKFDVVFNHTTLEHVYDFHKAFHNLCLMSKDIVIIVVPFVQQMHSDYGDFWRFSPQAIHRMFEMEGLEVAHLSFNNDFHSSVYILCIATKNSERWREHFTFDVDYVDSRFAHLKEPFAGCNAIHANWRTMLKGWLKSKFGDG
ncbi:hypothetical protein [Pelagibacterium montanilacus]|uniref:hypothetical protein n=1 Tax=Pelagibacterium montanilacus TaxID=2185280 RepID=UPI000F8DCAF9|nr:hypothetical protein [Pelagibacterium montanilacus]